MVLFLSAALAHGPPPQAVGVSAADASGPTFVRLTEGGAHRTDGGWVFACPALWGSVPEVPFGRSHDGTARLHGAFDLVNISPEGDVAAQGVPELAVLELLDLTRGPDSPWALRRVETGTELWRVAPASRVWSTAALASAVAVDTTGVFVSEVDTGRLDVVQLSPAGAEIGRRTWDDAVDYTPGLRRSQGETYLAKRRVGDHALVAADGTVLVTSANEILGPVQGLLVVDGLLYKLDGEAVVRTSEEAFVSCLEQVGSEVYACVFPDLYAVDPVAGVLAESVFELADLQPPRWSRVPASAADTCELEWRRIAADLGRELPLPTPSPDSGPNDVVEGGCGCGGRSLLLLPLIGLRRRRRAGRM